MENNRTAINHKQGHEQIAILKKERESHLFEAKGNKKPKHEEVETVRQSISVLPLREYYLPLKQQNDPRSWPRI